ncbi:LLM class flavin-dependent oxidoreductase [Amycolatopsis pigmentata]|uniref:LLM class flavin-dependent oxidoreductase n=1 Tax=Amycolatopsis pigmentata TaxID=450801 RepID=A0ABW5FMM4_9PSEU
MTPPARRFLPSPWTFLAHAAARTKRIRLATAITFLPLENPVRLAEDVSVVDILSGGRVEIGVGSGGSEAEYAAFGRDITRKRELTTEGLRILRSALAHIAGDVHRAALRFGERGAFPANLDIGEALRRFHAFYGHPDEIVAGLRQERVLPVATDLITQFDPAAADSDAAIRALELIATEIAPALGRRPVPQPEPQGV